MSEREEQELIERIARELRSGARFDAAFDDRVMAEVRRSAAGRSRFAGFRLLGTPAAVRPVRRATAWMVETRSLRVSPLAALAAAAGFALLVAGGTIVLRDGATGESTPVTAAATDTQTVKVVQFVLRAPDARSVALVGDFNEWDPRATPLRAVSDDGVWTISMPLPAGRHVYAFVVDGERWVADPVAPRAPGDDFGIPNSFVTVGGAS